jgi:hypothetical protein
MLAALASSALSPDSDAPGGWFQRIFAQFKLRLMHGQSLPIWLAN